MARSWAATAPPALGTSTLFEGPGSGTDSVVLYAPGAWTATTNASWLHLSAANQSGTGSTNVIFSFDANTGLTRTGMLTIAGRTLTVTQAASTYVAAPSPLTTLAIGFPDPEGIALDGAGNVYITVEGGGVIDEWLVASNTVRTVVSSGLGLPNGVALDGMGNLYIVDDGNPPSIYPNLSEWLPASNKLTTLVSQRTTGGYPQSPYGVMVDGAANVYYTDGGLNQLFEWVAASNNLITLIPSGLSEPSGVAMDVAGNLYVATFGNSSMSPLHEWLAASKTLITLSDSGLNASRGVAVDGSGNVYIADQDDGLIREWVAASNILVTLTSSHNPQGMAVDSLGNVYISDENDGNVYEKARAFVDPTTRSEGPSAGSDALPVVLPATENLLPPFAPTSSQSWLTIAGVTNGVVSFSFTANTGPARSANIMLFGQGIAVSQAGISPTRLYGTKILANGSLQFSFTNTPGASFTVLSSTNVSLQLDQWTQVGAPVEGPPGQYQFTGPSATNSQRFYIIRSP